MSSVCIGCGVDLLTGMRHEEWCVIMVEHDSIEMRVLLGDFKL